MRIAGVDAARAPSTRRCSQTPPSATWPPRSTDPPATLEQAAALAPAVTRFFEAVLVMAPDEAVRQNRLTLVANVAAALRTLGDFGQLPG